VLVRVERGKLWCFRVARLKAGREERTEAMAVLTEGLRAWKRKSDERRSSA
jgi:hypothetical protein